jgi:hypothetical protein
MSLKDEEHISFPGDSHLVHITKALRQEIGLGKVIYGD